MAHVLAVDDNRSNLELIAYLLRAFGHTVDGFNRSSDALAAAIKGRYDLILADVRMPEMDGYEFVRRYKSECSAPAPIVAVTALAMVGDKERLLEAGFDAYIAKPIEPESFKIAVDGVLKTLREDHPVVLAVDDIAVNLDVLESTLRPFGFRVERASSVAEAKAKLAYEHPALILCDIHMPEGNGFELIEYVKADDALRHIPFFVMSSTAWQTSEKQRAIALGAEKFILRPIEPQELVRHVRSAMERA